MATKVKSFFRQKTGEKVKNSIRAHRNHRTNKRQENKLMKLKRLDYKRKLETLKINSLEDNT